LKFTPRRENLQRQPAARFAILGGSFNPVHVAHVAFAEALARLPEITQVLAIPAALNPLKEAGALLPEQLRWRMVRAALEPVPKVSLLDIELARGAPSYTIETVHALRTAYPGAAFDVALGWDALRDFSRWRGAEELLELAGLIVVPRSGADGGPADFAEWVKCLPAPWIARLRPQGPGVWSDPGGRAVLRCLPVRLPDVSGSRILAERQWTQVPAAARTLLLRHLGAAAE
jgi:nicotinate-nucleotide adenylyltransferase